MRGMEKVEQVFYLIYVAHFNPIPTYRDILTSYIVMGYAYFFF